MVMARERRGARGGGGRGTGPPSRGRSGGGGGGGGRRAEHGLAFQRLLDEEVGGERAIEVVVGGGADHAEAGGGAGPAAERAGDAGGCGAVEGGGELVGEDGDGACAPPWVAHGLGQGEPPALAFGEGGGGEGEQVRFGEAGAGEGAEGGFDGAAEMVDHRAGGVEGPGVDGDHLLPMAAQPRLEGAEQGCLAAAAGAGDEGELAGMEGAVEGF